MLVDFLSPVASREGIVYFALRCLLVSVASYHESEEPSIAFSISAPFFS